MSGSVFRVIIPNQKIVVADLIAGRTPDPALGKQAKQRSVHNNYLTLPVIFLMLSNHYPLAWSSSYAIPIIGLVVIAGAAIRHYFNTHHAGQQTPGVNGYLDLGYGCRRLGARHMAVPCRQAEPRRCRFRCGHRAGGVCARRSSRKATLTLQGRCVMCHASEPFWPGIGVCA